MHPEAVDIRSLTLSEQIPVCIFVVHVLCKLIPVVESMHSRALLCQTGWNCTSGLSMPTVTLCANTQCEWSMSAILLYKY